MKLRRTMCGMLFAAGAFGLLMMDPAFAQPPGGGFGKGGFGKGGGEFGKGGGGFGQPPGGGGFGQPPGGGGKNPFTDPDTVFNFFSKGADVIDFSRMDQNQKAFARRSFEKAGLPPPTDTTIVSRAQFTEAFTRSLAAKGITPGGSPTPAPAFGSPPGGGASFRMEVGGDRDRGRGFGGPPSGGFGQPPGGGPPSYGGYGGNSSFSGNGASGNGSLEREKSSGPTSFRMTDQDIERRFIDSDANRDGKLSNDEVSDRSPLKASFQESDTNKDGYIDLTEYKAYIAVRFGGENADPNAGSFGSYAGNGNYGRDGGRDPRGDRKEEQPVVAIRFGKLPSGLPSWWDSLDTDKDGQVGLYEWRQDGREIKEFQSMDLDADGVLAPQEWFRSNTLKAEQAKAIAAEEQIGGSSGTGSKSGSGRPSFGTPGFGSSGNGGTKGGWPPSGGSGKESGGKGDRDKDQKNNPFRSGGKK